MVQFSEEALRKAAAAVAQALGPAGMERAPVFESLARYVVTLAKFGAHTDLVGARTPEALAEIALADALVLARRADLVRAPLWEIGAGGASLGVPIALMVPEVTGKLIEPRQKRATFLRLAIGQLGLAKRLVVEQGRVEPGSAPQGVAGCALGRAVFAPEVWIPMAARVVVPGGAFAVLTTEDLVLPVGFAAVASERYELPFARAKRVATWVQRA